MPDTALPPKGRGLNAPSSQSTPGEATLPRKNLLQNQNISFYAINGTKMTSSPFLGKQRANGGKAGTSPMWDAHLSQKLWLVFCESFWFVLLFKEYP